jgi:hypothetical protein
MPVERGRDPDLFCPLLVWDNRRYENGEDIDVGYNGHANLCFDGPVLSVEYVDLNGTLLIREQWQVDLASSHLQTLSLTKCLQDPELHCQSTTLQSEVGYGSR